MRQPNPRLCQPATLASDSMTTLTLQSVRRRLQIRDALRYRDDTNLRCPSPITQILTISLAASVAACRLMSSRYTYLTPSMTPKRRTTSNAVTSSWWNCASCSISLPTWHKNVVAIFGSHAQKSVCWEAGIIYIVSRGHEPVEPRNKKYPQSWYQ